MRIKKLRKPTGAVVSGNLYEVKEYVKVGKTKLPIVDIPMMSDYKWHVMCLKDRIDHPEKYEDIENVPETIERIKKQIECCLDQEDYYG